MPDHSNLFREALVRVHDITTNRPLNMQSWQDVREVVEKALAQKRAHQGFTDEALREQIKFNTGRLSWVSALLCFVSLLWCHSAAAATPARLLGKSVVVKWTNSFMLRPWRSQQPFHPSSSNHVLSVYISSAGRLFVRDSATSRRGSGAVEAVGTGQTRGGGLNVAEFQGAFLLIHAQTKQMDATTQIKVDFDAAFAGCNANVIVGKGAGVSTYKMTSLSTGELLEVQTVSAGRAGCTIRNGNVFAGEQ
jgi:hypothetical protein